MGDDEGRLGAGELMLLVAGEGMLATHALTKKNIVIGRSPESDVVVPSAMLSRRHARVVLGTPVTVQDLDSRNGTRVGGQLRKGGEPVPLDAGAAFHIGPVSFVIMGAGRAPSSAHGNFERPLRVTDPSFDGVSTHIHDIAASGANVLILGETGVGKEVLAETLHRLSKRTGPLVRINCATLSPTLLESELFGHEKGAFTGAVEARPGLLASAKGGTVFLDEVGELPAALQPKLLRAIETKEVLRVGGVRSLPVDLRFVAATNRDLPAEVARGNFRADLYFRLDGMTLLIPPLRERRSLIARLGAAHPAHRGVGLARKARGDPSLSTVLLEQLADHEWPGNARELRTAVERALLFARGGEVKLAHFGLKTGAVSTVAAMSPVVEADSGDQTPGDPSDQLAERARIVAALAECAGNQTRAARKLGISRATLATRLVIHRIPRPRR